MDGGQPASDGVLRQAASAQEADRERDRERFHHQRSKSASSSALSATGPDRSANTSEVDSDAGSQHSHGNGQLDDRKLAKLQVFPDAMQMKEKVRKALIKKTYNVCDYYKDKGWAQKVARNPAFEQFTLLVITFNAIWIWVDTDCNNAEVLIEADVIYQVMEHGFCAFFVLELLIRFLAFKWKRNCLRDAWFVFDSLLVTMAVLETWVMVIVMEITGGRLSGLGNTSMLRLFRLLRLSRMARMARLLRMIPELMILIKGMVAASRSVFLTLCMMFVIVYIFALSFTQLTAKSGSALSETYYKNVMKSMETLMLFGMFYDNTGEVWSAMVQESVFYALLFFAFIVLTTWTVMNMLIGVLCEVVSAVAATEKEEMNCVFVKGRLQAIMKESGLDQNHDGEISKDEFIKILENSEACRVLAEVGVDPIGLVDFADFIFEDEADPDTDERNQKNLSFSDFMEVILQLRGSNSSTVKDVVDLRKFIRTSNHQINQRLSRLEQMLLRQRRPVNSARSNHGRRMSADLGSISCKSEPAASEAKGAPRPASDDEQLFMADLSPMDRRATSPPVICNAEPRSVVKRQAMSCFGLASTVAARDKLVQSDPVDFQAAAPHRPGPPHAIKEQPSQRVDAGSLQPAVAYLSLATSPSAEDQSPQRDDPVTLQEWVARCEEDFAARQVELARLLQSQPANYDSFPAKPGSLPQMDGIAQLNLQALVSGAGLKRQPQAAGQKDSASEAVVRLLQNQRMSRDAAAVKPGCEYPHIPGIVDHGASFCFELDTPTARTATPPPPPPPPPRLPGVECTDPYITETNGEDWEASIRKLKVHGRAARFMDVLSAGMRELQDLKAQMY